MKLQKKMMVSSLFALLVACDEENQNVRQQLGDNGAQPNIVDDSNKTTKNEKSDDEDDKSTDDNSTVDSKPGETPNQPTPSSDPLAKGFFTCPAGSEALTPNLTGTPAQVPGVPIDDGFAPNFAILEGPLWFNGSLYFNEMLGGGNVPDSRLIKYTPGQGATVALATGGSNGLAIDTNNNLIVARHNPQGQIARLDFADLSQAAVPVATAFDNKAFNSPNDIAVRTDGNMYFSDPNYQAPMENPQEMERAYRIDPQGVVTAIAEPPARPNGVTLSLDQKTLYVAGNGPLKSYPLAQDGTVGAGAELVAGALGEVDGMAIDCAGNLYLATGTNIQVRKSDGSDLGTIAVGTRVTNVAFGGATGTTLFITGMGNNDRFLYQVDVAIPGSPY